MDTDDRIEGAKLIVEFMDWTIDMRDDSFFFKDFDCKKAVAYKKLWTDRNLQAEVLDEIEERGFVYFYIQNFWEVANTVGKDPMDETRRGWQIHTADAETIFNAIVQTLEREVE